MNDDPYVTLGLKKSATIDEIKKAHRRLVRESHPDLNPDNPDAEARFVAVSAAYELLKDPEKRARYDAGEIDAAGNEKPQRQYYRDFAETAGRQQGNRDFDGMNPEDILAEMFRQRGGRGRQGFAAAGQDRKYALEVPFMDAALGGKARITLPGGGSLDLTIPVGLKDGQTLRLRGKGDSGIGSGPDGDALVTVTVRPHPVYRRDGDDIHLTIPVTIDEAVLGAVVDVPTLTGTVRLTIPKGSSSGRILRLRGRGVKLRDKAGDQLVELKIVLPKDEDEKLTAFMEEWRKGRNDNPRDELLKGMDR